MVPTRTLTQSTTTIPEHAHSPWQQLDTCYTPDLPTILKSTTEPRRSQRFRQPSAHKLESDEYEADSHASARSPSPSKWTWKSKSESKKWEQGKRGNRPGRIIQPDTNTWPEGDEGLPEPLATAGPFCSGSRLASPGPASNPLERIDRAEALRCASAILGSHASRLLTKTLKKVLTAIKDNCEAGATDPMEIEEGGTSALMQSPRRVVLGSGYQPSAGGVANGADYLQGPDEQPAAHNSCAPEQSRLEAADDTATESEPKSEIIELGPGDSISQHIPPVPCAPLAHLQNPCPERIPHTPNHADEAEPAKDTRMDLDTAPTDEDKSDMSSNTDTESESEDELETAHAYKRQQLVSSSQRPPLPPHHQRSQLTVSHAQHSYLHPPANVLPVRMATNSSQTKPSTAPSSLPSFLASSQPPSMSDPTAVLEWAARLAKHSTADQGAGTSRHVTQTGPPSDNYQVLATVLDDLRRSWLASCKPLSFQSPAECPSSNSRRAKLVENDAAVLEAEAALSLGIHIRHQATLSDFPGFPRHIATLAIPEVIATAITEGAYESYGVTSKMANNCFGTTWKRELPDIRLQKPPPPLTGLIVHCISWFRGKATEHVCPAVASEYDFINPPQTCRDLKHNKRLARSLLPNTFHCKGLKAEVNQYEHSALSRAIATAYFWAPDSVSAVYHAKFYPLPLPAIAMALTVMQHCIAEWKTRQCIKTGLNVSTELNMYRCHYKGLLEYGKVAGHRLSGFQMDWFWYGIDYAGAAQDDDDEPYQAITRADRVPPDTLVPDDHAEPHSHSSAEARGRSYAVADVRHVSLAKGKGRAVH